MAVTISRYNHTTRLILDEGVIDLDSLKVMLLNDSASFDATDTTLDEVAGANTPPRANEVSGSGWDTGGEVLSGVSVTTTATSGAMLDADDVDVDATGGAIGPAYKAVIFDDAHADKAPLWFIDFDGAQTAGEGTPFKITWHSNGIARITSPA